MEPENIGIGNIIEAVYRKPEKWSRFVIAPMVLRLLAKETRQQNEWKPASIREAVLTADRHPTIAQLDKVSALVLDILNEHMVWIESNESSVDHESRSLVGRACMHLLWDWLHARWQRELAHYIHNSNHISSQPARLHLLDHGIIPDNRILHTWGDENTQLWSGNDTQRKYRWKWHKWDSVIVLLKKEKEGADFKVNIALRGQKNHIAETHILNFTDTDIEVYDNNPAYLDEESHFLLYWKFPCEIGQIETIEPAVKTKNWWYMYRVTGTKTIENQNEESTSITQKMTFCMNPRNLQLSYTTTSKRFVMDGQGFTLDTTNGVIIVLAQWDTVRIPYSKIIGLKKEWNGQEYFVFNQDWVQKKLTFSGGEPEVSEMAE